MTKRIAYFDCFSGASGDMLLGALLDAGLSLKDLQDDLSGLGLSDYELSAVRQVRQGISGTKFDVLDHGRYRPAQNIHAISHILKESSLPQQVIETSLQVFMCLAKAEAGVHGTDVEQVHFHELGAVDSLVDIVGFCCAVRRLEIEALFCSPLPAGGGRIRTEHGWLPVPAPATLAILASANAPLVPSEAHGELVTPTGAALLSTLASFSQPPMRVQRVGYGFGTKEFPWPNALRVWIGEALPDKTMNPMAHSHTHETGHDHEHGHSHSA